MLGNITSTVVGNVDIPKESIWLEDRLKKVGGFNVAHGLPAEGTDTLFLKKYMNSNI